MVKKYIVLGSGSMDFGILGGKLFTHNQITTGEILPENKLAAAIQALDVFNEANSIRVIELVEDEICTFQDVTDDIISLAVTDLLDLNEFHRDGRAVPEWADEQYKEFYGRERVG